MDELWALPATAIAALVRARAVSVVEVTEAALARLDAVNPALNAVVQTFADRALDDARTHDARLSAGHDLGPLAGVPITVKVNTDQAGHATTNGVALQADRIAERDAPMVANLRRAGAVVVGRTNTPGFSMRWFCRSALHGDTLNPHDAALTPGGSSGGAGAAAAAGIGALAQGTDIAGSVRYPAYACNLHGLRPSLGRVPNANASSPDRAIGPQIMAVSGPLARSIDDVALALRAMAAADACDPWHVAMPLEGPPLPRRCALALAPDGMAVAPEVSEAVLDAAKVLEAAGWVVQDVETPPMRPAVDINLALWMGDLRQGGGLVRIEAAEDRDATLIGRRLMAIAEAGPGVEAALQQRLGLVRAWQQFVADWPLVLCPVSGAPPFAAHADVGDEAAWAAVFDAQLTQIALPVLGLPGLTVATGRPGRPMGVQLIAPRWREDVLLAAGRAIAAAHPPIRPVDPFAAAGAAQGPAVQPAANQTVG
ncbi:MAG: amidase [Pseudomonadota bacterium]